MKYYTEGVDNRTMFSVRITDKTSKFAAAIYCPTDWVLHNSRKQLIKHQYPAL